MLISDKFQLSGTKAKDDRKQVISQFYHSPADNRRVSLSQYGWWGYENEVIGTVRAVSSSSKHIFPINSAVSNTSFLWQTSASYI